MAVGRGPRIGPYEITALLGKGGMGEVYRATDSRLGRHVAVKVLPEAKRASPERDARFEREARLLASINHPNIATMSSGSRAQPRGHRHPPQTGQVVPLRVPPSTHGCPLMLARARSKYLRVSAMRCATIPS